MNKFVIVLSGNETGSTFFDYKKLDNFIISIRNLRMPL
jgi:hypothetical protein